MNRPQFALWLDDVRSMPEGFDFHVRTVEEAVTVLRTGRVTHISFDNDLGEDAGEGYQVADYVESAAFHKEILPLTWTVHSANPVRRSHIEAAMGNAEKFWRRK